MELSNLLRYTTRLPKNLKEGLIEITPVEIVGLNYVMTKNKSNKFAADFPLCGHCDPLCKLIL